MVQLSRPKLSLDDLVFNHSVFFLLFWYVFKRHVKSLRISSCLFVFIYLFIYFAVSLKTLGSDVVNWKFTPGSINCHKCFKSCFQLQFVLKWPDDHWLVHCWGLSTMDPTLKHTVMLQNNFYRGSHYHDQVFLEKSTCSYFIFKLQSFLLCTW